MAAAILKTVNANKEAQGNGIPSSVNTAVRPPIFDLFELSEMPAPSKYAVWALLPQWAAPLFFEFFEFGFPELPALNIEPRPMGHATVARLHTG